MEIRLIETNKKLSEELNLLKTESILGIDTEVFQPNFYTNHLLTLQISNGQIVWVINCQKVMDLSPIYLHVIPLQNELQYPPQLLLF